MRHDIAVVGGGPIGRAFSLAAAEAGMSVALLDAQSEEAVLPEVGFDLRVSAINRASEAFLASIGCWQHLPRERITPFVAMHVWDSVGRGRLEFDGAAAGTDRLGTLVENAAVQGALLTELDRHSNVQFFRGARLEALHVGDERAILNSGGERLEASVVVGADGARSTVRELADLPTRVRSYDQVAVVANIRMADSHEHTAWQVFLPTGPLAVLPLPGNIASIVWTTTPEHAETLLGASTESFNLAVGEAFEHRLGDVVWSSERAAFPLYRVEATQYVCPRVALIGDAAHTIHPLAGQGVNLGFMDAATLAETLVAARSRGRDMGGISTLRRYERWRKTHNASVQNLMDALRWLFGFTNPGIAGVRSLGMNTVQAAPPIKRQLARLASGLDGDLPARAVARF
jgi:2-octaprenylphenol hydroxylase